MMMTGAGKPDDPLTRPIAPESAKRWLAPQPAVRLHGATYLVGFGGLNVALIRTSAGLILIDGAVPQAVGDIERKIAAMGFSIRQVKLILSTEPHFDHAGGIAALARDSSATVIASGPAAAVLRQGGGDPDDPQAAWLERFPGVTKLRVARDGETIRLGDTIVTAQATPGHTLGSMSWRWKSCEGKDCRTIVFAASLNPIAADGWRFADPAHRQFVAAFRSSIARMKVMPCDMLIASHPQDGDAERVAQLARARTPNPFVDPGVCRRYAERAETALAKKLAE
ncbi:subclass B3 metallo-beta-lactamase [Sphingobium sp. WCS2017Hpa-17]|uniref:subclass B3 metallo-beta-lactamase n=1 Tax=Sphingobium sp. WCS2017Hpa-17 TaxID=3073638 RepID=UPI00288A3192|nr:subclass B3 metallo-beta-lactamase [Sphingobium sp. WCS2017Hpa-17]